MRQSAGILGLCSGHLNCTRRRDVLAHLQRHPWSILTILAIPQKFEAGGTCLYVTPSAECIKVTISTYYFLSCSKFSETLDILLWPPVVYYQKIYGGRRQFLKPNILWAIPAMALLLSAAKPASASLLNGQTVEVQYVVAQDTGYTPQNDPNGFSGFGD